MEENLKKGLLSEMKRKGRIFFGIMDIRFLLIEDLMSSEIG